MIIALRALTAGAAGDHIVNMDDEKLIEAIRSFPCLWQVSSKGYKDARARENAWREVAMRVSMIVYLIYHTTSSQILAGWRWLGF